MGMLDGTANDRNFIMQGSTFKRLNKELILRVRRRVYEKRVQVGEGEVKGRAGRKGDGPGRRGWQNQSLQQYSLYSLYDLVELAVGIEWVVE